MKTFISIIFGAYFLLGFCVLPAQTLIGTKIDRVAEKYVNKHRNRGLVIGVIHGNEIDSKGYGHLSAVQDFTPDENTIFEIGALSSVFTTTLMMLESQTGRFNTIDPINQFLPSDVMAPNYLPFICKIEDTPGLLGSGEVSPRMICEPDPLGNPVGISFCDLASHTSGLPNAPKGLYSMNPLLWNMKNGKDPYHDYSREALYDNLYKHVLSLPPGAFFNYSNAGMALLGNLVADMNGMSYYELVDQNILSKLHMRDTYLEIRPEDSYRFASGHSRRGKPVEHWHFDGMAPAGGLRSTAGDLLRFLDANLEEGEAPMQRAFRQVHQARIDVPKHKNKRETMAGYGWFVSILSEESNLPVNWIGGGTGGFRSFMAFNKDKDMAVVILSNSANSVKEMGFEILEYLAKISNQAMTTVDQKATERPNY